MWVKLGALAVLVYACLVGAMYWMQDSLLYLPHIPSRTLSTTPSEHGMAYREVTLNTDDGEQLTAWHVPVTQRRGTVLVAHGNAGNISHRMETLRLWHELGFEVLIFDYRGYGGSTGEPHEQGLYRDLASAWHWLVVEQGISPHEIVLFGRSLGAAVTAELATRTRPGALILESPFTSLPDLGAELYPWLPVRLLAREHYPVAEHASQATAPVMVLHSRDDEIVPFAHGRAVYRAAPEPKSFFAMQGGHNEGFLASRDAYARAIDAFLRTAGL